MSVSPWRERLARCFSRAAPQLYIAQPALSRQIAKVEEEIGVILLIRHGHGCQAVRLAPDAGQSGAAGFGTRARGAGGQDLKNGFLLSVFYVCGTSST